MYSVHNEFYPSKMLFRKTITFVWVSLLEPLIDFPSLDGSKTECKKLTKHWTCVTG